MTAVLFALGGVTAGAMQARMLSRAARSGPSPLTFVARFTVVALVLLFAAVHGQLGPAAAGWFAGLAVACTALYRRLG